MKKLLTVILTCVLFIFTTSGCGKGSSTKQSQTTSGLNQQVQSAQIVTPNVLSSNKDTAKKELEELGFFVELQEAPEYDSNIADGEIVEQSLNEGVVVVPNSKIILTYNSARFRWVYHLGDDESTKELAYLYDCQGKYNKESIEIPAEIDGYKITQWTLSNSLDKYNSIKTIYLPNGVDSNKFYHDTVSRKNKGIKVVVQ